MDLGKLFKWIVIIAIVIFAWKVGVPKIKEKLGSSSGSSAASSSAGDVEQTLLSADRSVRSTRIRNNCVDRAAAASEAWGSGLGRFVNPPVDLNEWGNFRTSRPRGSWRDRGNDL